MKERKGPKVVTEHIGTGIVVDIATGETTTAQHFITGADTIEEGYAEMRRVQEQLGGELQIISGPELPEGGSSSQTFKGWGEGKWSGTPGRIKVITPRGGDTIH